MPTKLKVYANEDDTLLFWSIPAPIPGCRGFAIARRKTSAAGKKTEDFLVNRTGFENEKVKAKPEAGQEAVVKPPRNGRSSGFRGRTTMRTAGIQCPTG